MLAASRSAWRRALQKMMVLLCSRTRSKILGYTLGQMLERRSVSAAVAGPLRNSVVGLPRSPMSSTATITCTSSSLRTPALTICTLRAIPSRDPPRNRATSSSGRCVADSPMRWNGLTVISSSRSRETIRCAPRLVGASAWISSMITVSTLASVSRAADVSIKKRDSGVVIKMSGGLRTSCLRSLLDVSPVRMPTVGSTNISPNRSAACWMPTIGARRFFSTSKASARSGEMYSTRVRWMFGGSGSLTR